MCLIENAWASAQDRSRFVHVELPQSREPGSPRIRTAISCLICTCSSPRAPSAIANAAACWKIVICCAIAYLIADSEGPSSPTVARCVGQCWFPMRLTMYDSVQRAGRQDAAAEYVCTQMHEIRWTWYSLADAFWLLCLWTLPLHALSVVSTVFWPHSSGRSQFLSSEDVQFLATFNMWIVSQSGILQSLGSASPFD